MNAETITITDLVKIEAQHLGVSTPVFLTNDSRILAKGGGLVWTFEKEKQILVHRRLTSFTPTILDAVILHEEGHIVNGHKWTDNVFTSVRIEAEADMYAAERVGLMPVVQFIVIAFWAAYVAACIAIATNAVAQMDNNKPAKALELIFTGPIRMILMAIVCLSFIFSRTVLLAISYIVSKA